MEKQRIYLWGTGKIARYVCYYFKNILNQYQIEGFIDNDSKKEGTTFETYPIYEPSVLKKDRDAFIIILCAEYEEIKDQILNDYPWYAEKTDTFTFFTKQRLIARYQNSDDQELIEVLNYLKDHQLSVFNYEYTEKYSATDIEVFYDDDKSLYYIMYDNKKMYFARYFKNSEEVKEYYRQILIEQDLKSPHRYLTDTFNVDEGSVIVDAGVAEGNFALSVIDKVKKVYLFEPDIDWVEALRYTFAPYKEKVVIVNKYLSDYVDENTTTLDDVIGEDHVDFIKVDVEGEEYYALKGADKIFKREANLKCIVCTYHREFDDIVLNQLLQKYGLHTEVSNGYMWYAIGLDSIFALPTLRKGIIRAEKNYA